MRTNSLLLFVAGMIDLFTFAMSQPAGIQAAAPATYMAEVLTQDDGVGPAVAAQNHVLFLALVQRPFVGAWHYIAVAEEAFAYFAGGDPAAYVPPGTTDHHLYYRATDNEIDELWWSDGSWTHRSVTLFDPTAPDSTGDPAAYYTASTGSSHVYYRGTDSQIHELWFSNDNWTHIPTGQIAGATPAATGDPTAYVQDGTTNHRVFYRATDNHIHELAWTNGQWVHQDISQLAGSQWLLPASWLPMSRPSPARTMSSIAARITSCMSYGGP